MGKSKPERAKNQITIKSFTRSKQDHQITNAIEGTGGPSRAPVEVQLQSNRHRTENKLMSSKGPVEVQYMRSSEDSLGPSQKPSKGPVEVPSRPSVCLMPPPSTYFLVELIEHCLHTPLAVPPLSADGGGG